MAFEPICAESAPIFVKNSSFHFFKNPHLCLFSWVLEVKLKFQDNSYNRINNNKCPSSEKEDEVCILRKSYFHQIQPTYDQASHLAEARGTMRQDRRDGGGLSWPFLLLNPDRALLAYN